MPVTDIRGTGDQTQQKDTAVEPSTTPKIIIGLDIGKSGHHAYALASTGERIYGKPLPQDEATRHEIFASMQAHSSVLMVVDQHNTIGALPIAVTRGCGCTVGDLPDLAMQKAVDLYPRRSKTDRQDVFIIADTTRTMPHTLRAVDRDDETPAALKMLAGFHDSIAKDATRTKNHLRSVFTQIHPELGRVFASEILSRTLVLDSLIHYEDRQNWPPQVEAGS